LLVRERKKGGEFFTIMYVYIIYVLKFPILELFKSILQKN